MAEYLCEEDMSTGEYISRDLALRQLNATCLATDCDNYNGVRCRACAYADAMDFIEAIPAADVQPIHHGHWIPKGNDMWLCSNCKENIIYSEHESDRAEKQRYCCRCGARMDGGIDG